MAQRQPTARPWPRIAARERDRKVAGRVEFDDITLEKGALHDGSHTAALDCIEQETDLPAALRLAVRFGVYAYDAYFLECALSCRLPLLTLDRGMQRLARELGIPIVE